MQLDAYVVSSARGRHKRRANVPFGLEGAFFFLGAFFLSVPVYSSSAYEASSSSSFGSSASSSYPWVKEYKRG